MPLYLCTHKIYIYTCVCIYIYAHYLCTYIYIYVCVYTCVYIYMYLCIKVAQVEGLRFVVPGISPSSTASLQSVRTHLRVFLHALLLLGGK